MDKGKIYNAAIALGYTRHVYIDFGSQDLDALVRTDVGTDGRFLAFDIDNNEWLEVYGWLATVEDV